MGIIRKVGSVIREWKKGRERSPQWNRVRKQFLKEHKSCEACGGKYLLQVHHMLPFHSHPELELDPKNLIVLCMGKNECHLDIGHGGNWKSYNPNVENDAIEFSRGNEQLAEARAKANRRRG